MTIYERRGRFYDEYEIGDVFRHKPGRTITEADNTLFTTLTMNTQSLHLDAEVAAKSEFGQRLVNSLMTLAIAAGLSVGDTTEGTTIANLGFGEISFPRPVFIGDTLYAETEIIDKRESKSRPGQGVVTFEHRARNQRDEIVCTARRSALVWFADAHAAATAEA
ncbi:MAG: MaoC family dehydratase [Ilumatobacter fluminis]|uniref:Acyl dehydratase n=1 Tax=Ilumatobacter fluminis TaxID=467091 RepID=A0A4R7I3P4_9ACTN|nr:MaoC family dehydratase [Ilumatobacter fluminis]TDT18267.1 acyl dehydratase [Ilumatobacter fluminis]